MRIFSQGRIGTLVWDPPKDLIRKLEDMPADERKAMLDLYLTLFEMQAALLKDISNSPPMKRGKQFVKLIDALRNFSRRLGDTCR